MQCPHCQADIPEGFKFCGNCGQKVGEAPAPEPPSVPAQPAHRDERRDVSVLFADVKGFTTMCERMDPEEVHVVMNACFDGLAQKIAHEGGHIDKYIGDNIMALFGAPIAHEDDPARACRAALAMQTFLNDFGQRYKERTGVVLQMRVGIHCGLVVAGRVGSDEVRKDYTVMGDAVNLAARLESNAAPGTILVSKDIVRRVRGQFEFAEEQKLEVKGKADAVIAQTLLSAISDVDPRGRDGLSVEMIGRERELHELVGGLRATPSECPWIEIIGELGIGKTRLVEESVKQVPSLTLLPVVATSISQKRPFGLVRRLVHQITQYKLDGQPFPKSRDEFQEVFSEWGTGVELYMEALWFLTAPSDLAIAPPDPDPQTLRSMVEQGIRSLLEYLAKEVPELVVFVDSFEFGDEESVALLERFGRSAVKLGIKFLITSRHRTGTTLSTAKRFFLSSLEDSAASELLDRLVRQALLPKELKENLLERAAGVPLFLEEMIRLLVDKKLLNTESSNWSFCEVASESGEKIEVELPSSIRGTMVTRIDRLKQQERDLLCQCAVQGIEFYEDIASHTSGLSDAGRVVDGLNALSDSGVVREITMTDRRKFVFVQPLLQEACYETLLLRERRELHGKVAQGFCKVLGGAESVSPEILVYHHTLAEEWGEAAQANFRQGEREAQLFFNDRAIASYQQTIDELHKLQSRSAIEERLEVQALGGISAIHSLTGAYEDGLQYAEQMIGAATHTDELVEGNRLKAEIFVHTGRAEDAENILLDSIGSGVKDKVEEQIIARSVFDLAELYHRQNNIDEALKRVEECHRWLSDENHLLAIRLEMLRGVIAQTRGRFEDAVGFFEQARDLSEEHDTISELAHALKNLGNVKRDTGEYQEAKTYFEEALELWERTGNVHCISGAHNNLGNIAMSVGDLDTARTHQEKALIACQEIGNVHGAAMAQANLAFLYIDMGDGAKAVELAEAALHDLGSAGEWLRALILNVLGEAHLEAENVDLAEESFQQVMDEFEREHHPLAMAGALRGIGRVHAMRDDLDEASKLFTESVLLFEELKRLQEAARTRLWQAEVLCSLGDKDKAFEVLEHARNVFQDINAERDLERAQTLTERLSD